MLPQYIIEIRTLKPFTDILNKHNRTFHLYLNPFPHPQHPNMGDMCLLAPYALILRLTESYPVIMEEMDFLFYLLFPSIPHNFWTSPCQVPGKAHKYELHKKAHNLGDPIGTQV